MATKKVVSKASLQLEIAYLTGKIAEYQRANAAYDTQNRELRVITTQAMTARNMLMDDLQVTAHEMLSRFSLGSIHPLVSAEYFRLDTERRESSWLYRFIVKPLTAFFS